MKLNYEQIKEITTGAVRVLENGDKIEFHRFTDEQEIIYGKISQEQDRKFNERCKASAGIRFFFKTNIIHFLTYIQMKKKIMKTKQRTVLRSISQINR